MNADPDPVPDPAYKFDADPDFYLMRMRIQVTKMVRIRNTAQYRKCLFQIVLESGSDDSQPGLILPSGEIN
jgi:hypothetical protein